MLILSTGNSTTTTTTTTHLTALYPGKPGLTTTRKKTFTHSLPIFVGII